MKMYQIPLPFFGEDFFSLVCQVVRDRSTVSCNFCLGLERYTEVERLDKIIEYFEVCKSVLYRSFNFIRVSFSGNREYYSGWVG